MTTLREWSRATGSYAGHFPLLDQLYQSRTCIVFNASGVGFTIDAVSIIMKEARWNLEVCARQFGLQTSDQPERQALKVVVLNELMNMYSACFERSSAHNMSVAFHIIIKSDPLPNALKTS